MINKIVSKLLCLSNSGKLAESVFFSIIDEENVSFDIIPKIYEALINKGIKIVSLTSTESIPKTNKLSRNLSERRSFYLEQQENYLRESGELIKKKFFEDYFKSRAQSTYMPVAMLGLFENADEYGKVHIDDLVAYFNDYYIERKNQGLLIERPDSIFAKSEPSYQEIKRLILFNPLGRSCLVKYIRYNEKSEFLEFNENFWRVLSISDVIRIKNQSKKIIENYYQKLMLK